MFCIILTLVICNHSCIYIWIIFVFYPREVYELPVVTERRDWYGLAVSSGLSVKAGLFTDCRSENRLPCLFAGRIGHFGCDLSIYRLRMFCIILTLVICNHSCIHVWISIVFYPCEVYELPVMTKRMDHTGFLMCIVAFADVPGHSFGRTCCS